MSGDVQPRKRKDKRKKKDEDEFVHHSAGSSDEVIHIYKESKLGGNVCAKIVFFGLLGALGIMVGLIIFEYHGTSDVDTASAADSPWSLMLEGWVDNSPDDHEHGDEHGGGDHDDDHEHGDDEHEHDEHEDHDHEYSEDEHEETEEETEDEAYVKQTFEELRAAYTQAPVEEAESEVEDITEESIVKSTDYGATESEPEASEPEEEEEEEELQEDEPVPQWKSESGRDILAEEVEEVQTGTETEEEESEEEPAPRTGGPKSAEVEDEQESRDFVDESIPEPVVFSSESKVPTTNEPEQPESDNKEEIESAEYEKADVTNPADWEIREELDEAEKELDEGDYL